MIIHSLQLDNFRQFINNQKISFSTDPSRSATILIAESGFGKTTLLQSFMWAFYGKCKYKTILNTDVKNQLRPNQGAKVTVIVTLEHNGKMYEIIRRQDFWKRNVRVDSEDSTITVNEKMIEDGTSTQYRGRDANRIIRSIMHPDLFPYFFLEGERAESIGEQMSKGKSGSNNEFVQAIKGLLGFNHLYEGRKHLSSVIRYYDNEIARLTTDVKLRQNIEAIQRIDDEVDSINKRLEQIDADIQYFTEQRNQLSDKIQLYGGVAEKQRRVDVLVKREIPNLEAQIIDQKKYIFKKFSQQIPYLVMKCMLPEAKAVLQNSDALDKGIPGINVDAVKYMLEHHKCICGEELVEGSEHWKMLTDWITYLPPNNIGFELERFDSEIKTVDQTAIRFSQDFERARKALNDLIKKQHEAVQELENLHREIGSVNEDVGALKTQELEYNSKITSRATEKGNKQQRLEQLKIERQKLVDAQTVLRQQDQKTNKLQMYHDEASALYNRFTFIIEKREKEKREALEKAINEIFKEFYQGTVKFKLDDSYNVQITGFQNELYDDFTSGGQDVAVALAFIGAIVKLKIEDSKNQGESEDGDEDGEIYPLVMDAPTSKFGEAQVRSFSRIMPNLTDQIIIFVNDVYGPKLKEAMSQFIGKQWTIERHDEFHGTLREVK